MEHNQISTTNINVLYHNTDLVYDKIIQKNIGIVINSFDEYINVFWFNGVIEITTHLKRDNFIEKIKAR